MNTLYGTVSNDIYERMKHVKLLVCDVDGVFSDGRIYLGNEGEELKAFHTRDGYGIKALVDNGIDVAVITGRRSQIVEKRMQSLNVKHIIQGEEKKRDALEQLCVQYHYAKDDIATVGDDMPDTGMFELANLSIAVADAHPIVRQRADWVTSINGGMGAVREICDTILQAQQKLTGIQAASV